MLHLLHHWFTFLSWLCCLAQFLCTYSCFCHHSGWQSSHPPLRLHPLMPVYAMCVRVPSFMGHWGGLFRVCCTTAVQENILTLYIALCCLRWLLDTNVCSLKLFTETPLHKGYWSEPDCVFAAVGLLIRTTPNSVCSYCQKPGVSNPSRFLFHFFAFFCSCAVCLWNDCIKVCFQFCALAFIQALEILSCLI